MYTIHSLIMTAVIIDPLPVEGVLTDALSALSIILGKSSETVDHFIVEDGPRAVVRLLR